MSWYFITATEKNYYVERLSKRIKAVSNKDTQYLPLASLFKHMGVYTWTHTCMNHTCTDMHINTFLKQALIILYLFIIYAFTY